MDTSTCTSALQHFSFCSWAAETCPDTTIQALFASDPATQSGWSTACSFASLAYNLETNCGTWQAENARTQWPLQLLSDSCHPLALLSVLVACGIKGQTASRHMLLMSALLTFDRTARRWTCGQTSVESCQSVCFRKLIAWYLGLCSESLTSANFTSLAKTVGNLSRKFLSLAIIRLSLNICVQYSCQGPTLYGPV